MQISKEQQREIRKPSSVINEKKQRKTTEWERQEIYSRKLETKGIFHTNMGTVKDRNYMDLTEAEDIKKILRRDGIDILQDPAVLIFILATSS